MPPIYVDSNQLSREGSAIDGMGSRLTSYIKEMRELEDDAVRRFTWNNYGPMLRISNIFGSMDEGWIYLTFLHALVVNLFMYTYLYLFFITCFHLKDDFVLVGVQFHYLLLALFGSTFMAFMYMRRREFLFIAKTVSDGFFTYAHDQLWAEERKDFLREMRKQRLKLIPFIVLIGLIGFFIVVMGPLIDNMVGAGYKGDYLNGVYMKTPIPMYFPFVIDSEEKHNMVTGFQVVTVGMLALCISTVMFMYIVCVQNLAFQFKILIVSLRKLTARSKLMYKKLHPKKLIIRKDDPRYQECVEFCLKENAKHHQEMKAFYRAQTDLVGHPIMAAFFMGTAVLALSMMILVEKSNRMGLLITNTLAMSGELGNLYITCSFGEDILTLSDELFETVYGVDWTHMNKKNKKIILSLQDCTKFPMVIRGSLFFTCSMETFSSICNSAYSYYNMLSASSVAKED